MNAQVARFVNAFLILSDTDKSEVIEIVRAIASAKDQEMKAKFVDSIGLEDAMRAALNLGPFPGPCPTCGQ